MDLFNDLVDDLVYDLGRSWQLGEYILQWFTIKFIGPLACLTAVALAKFAWSSVIIPDVAFTCLGNLAVFKTAFTRGRLDRENGARDVLVTTRGPKLNAINGCRGLTTCLPNYLRDVDVVLLSKYNHSSVTQFMQYISHSHALESILLQFIRFKSAPVTAEICKCDMNLECQCVVFWATEEIMIMLAHRLPGTLKQLSESQCLLPSLSCLKNNCHGCNQGLLCVDEYWDVEAAGKERRLKEHIPRVDSPAAKVCEALEGGEIGEESSCICISVHPGNADRWTKFLIKFLKSEEKEAKGIKVAVSDVLQCYITRTGTDSIVASERYTSASFILRRVAEVIVNIALTGLRVDGISSSLFARWASRDYADSTGTGFSANAFLTRALVFGSADWTNVCQVLEFRRGILSARRVSYMVGCVNLICSITWSVLIACKGNWAPSTPLSTPRFAVIIGAVGIAVGMDCFELYGGQFRALFRAQPRPHAQVWARPRPRDLARAQIQAQARARARAQVLALMAVVILEVGCIVSLVVRLSMKKRLGRWVYSGIQVLVWVKWGIGSFLLGDNATEDEDGRRYVRRGNRGTWVYCSAFLLNAILVYSI